MIKKQILEDLNIAIKNKNKESISTIRLMLSAIKDKEILIRSDKKIKEITEEMIFNIFKNMIKQRNESVEMYKKGNRPELVDKENNEISIIKKYLPDQLSNNDMEKICNELIEELNANAMSDMGKVMNALKKHKLSSQIDIAKASSYVKVVLNN
tara:strand:- start:15835 stop:16296 length:462 start_codon:yes stop_codon:yes gene_type:complete